MTLSLRVLGPLELVGSDGTEVRRVLQQPKRLGLLAYFALRSPQRFHRRDALLALFWPDLDTEHARSALRRSLYFLRRELGDGIVVGRSEEEVGLADDSLRCDAAEFEAAVKQGEHDRALQLYRGHLLEGFFVAGAPDVVDWLDGERTRLRDMALLAAWTLVGREQTPPAVSLHWGRWAAATAPDDEGNVARYIALLVRLGERSQALRAYRDLERRLEMQFGVSPSRATAQLVEQAKLAEAPAPLAGIAAAPSTAAAVAIPAPSGTSDSASSDDHQSEENPHRVVVAPFVVRGSAAVQYLGEGVMELVSGAFGDAGEVHAVDAGAVLAEVQRRPSASAVELASFFRAPRYIDGTVFEAGGRIRLQATLRITATRAVVARGEGEATDEVGLFRLVDDVVRQLVTSLPASPGTRLARAAARTVESIPALKAFLRAERDFRLGRLFEAIVGFGEATRYDPGFGVAHYRLASALAAAAQVGPAREACARALAARDRVSEREWALFHAQDAWLAGDAAEAELRYAGLLARWPEDLEAHYLHGDLRMHTNPDRGRSIQGAKSPLKETLRLDPGHVGTQVKLARLAALAGRHARACEHADRALRLSPDGDQALPVRALRAWLVDDATEQRAVLAALRSARAQTLMIAFADVAVYGGDLAKAERFGTALTDIIESEDLRTVSWLVRAYVAFARGRIAAGFAMLQEQRSARPTWARELAALVVAGSAFPAGCVPLGTTRDEVAAWPEAANPTSHFPLLTLHDGLHAHLRLYLLGKLDARLDRLGDASASAEALAEEPVAGLAEALVPHLLRDLTATVREGSGRHEEALRVRRAHTPGVWYQFAIGSPFFGGVEQRFRQALALEACGREREAIGWYASIAERSPWELPWKAPAARRLAGIHERLGEASRAAEQYRLFISLWDHADGELQPMVEDARARLAALTAGST
ncbi:MAG TPA: BTAD domain-containing putative transcriptional regulator [Gemmatimonadales bacterium]|nr:BTAD domain-containing putative transcriptional regulator [Gemmatimonadales bacterium]